MNNDLAQFSENMLEKMAVGDIYPTVLEQAALARIALSVKQAKPVAQVYQPANIGICAALGPAIRMINVGLPAGTLLYTTPQPAHTEQDGWKLVPVEPTEDMVKAGCRFASEHNAKGSWSKMLAAAPKPESEL